MEDLLGCDGARLGWAGLAATWGQRVFLVSFSIWWGGVASKGRRGVASPLCLSSLNDYAGREPPVTPGPGQTAASTRGAARLGLPLTPSEECWVSHFCVFSLARGAQ